LKQATEPDDQTVILARSNPILGTLSPTTVGLLLAQSEPVDFDPQAVLVEQGHTSDCAYLIVDGEAEVQVHTSFGDVHLASVGPGALIGEIGVFADLPRNATVRAKTHTRALRLDREHLRAAGDRDPALLRSVVGRLGSHIARFNGAIGLYTNAVNALERDDFNLAILDELRQPGPELLDFAHQFRRMAEQIVERRAREAEMASAAAIQRAMLPDRLTTAYIRGDFEIAGRMKPAREVGGDLFDIIELDDARIVITIGDVCGKGVPAALFMAVTQTVMRLVMRAGDDLLANIVTANDLLVADNREDMFATLFCGVLDIGTGRLTYCNCGHNPPLVRRCGQGAFDALRACGPPLGVMAGIPYEVRTVTLAPGDLLFLYTDGVTEAEDAATAQFGTERLEHALSDTDGSAAEAIVGQTLGRVAEFTAGAPQSDDITCLAVVRGRSRAAVTPSPARSE
jgi:phosphoserine phosphatase RsbU/P